MKSFVPKDRGGKPPSVKSGGGRNAERDFHGEKRKNDTHCSTTDPDARLFRKSAGKEAELCHMGHLMTENRNGLRARPPTPGVTIFISYSLCWPIERTDPGNLICPAVGFVVRRHRSLLKSHHRGDRRGSARTAPVVLDLF